jgi:predicted lipoprotein with Yx(FWY)xxD motif
MTSGTRRSNHQGVVMDRRYRWVIAALASLALLAAGCGDDDDADTSSSTTEASTETTDGDDTTSTTAEPGASTVLIGTEETDIGSLLTDSDGLTLYVFDADTDGEPTCTDSCAEEWPPLVAENIETHGELDIDATSIETADGTQVTINGRPVYRYAGDSAPGDTNGQGIGGIWWALDVDGNPISTTGGGAGGQGGVSDSGEGEADPTTSAPSAGGYNY